MSVSDPSLSEENSDGDVHLLAKLEEANRHLEADSKSVSSLMNQPFHHSRQASISSQLSWNSIASSSRISPEPGMEAKSFPSIFFFNLLSTQ